MNSTSESRNFLSGSGKFIETPFKLDRTSILGSMKGCSLIKEGSVNLILNIEDPLISFLF